MSSPRETLGQRIQKAELLPPAATGVPPTEVGEVIDLDALMVDLEDADNSLEKVIALLVANQASGGTVALPGAPKSPARELLENIDSALYDTSGNLTDLLDFQDGVESIVDKFKRISERFKKLKKEAAQGKVTGKMPSTVKTGDLAQINAAADAAIQEFREYLSDFKDKFDQQQQIELGLEKVVVPTSAEREQELKELAGKRIQALYDEIRSSNEKVSGNDYNNSRVSNPLEGDNINKAGLLPLVERFFPEELSEWRNVLAVYDGFSAAAGAGGYQDEQLVFKKPKEARFAAIGYVDFAHMKELQEIPEIGAMIRYAEDIFKEPQEYKVLYLREDGTEINFATSTPLERRNAAKRVLLSPTDSNPNASDVIKHDYTYAGDPLPEKKNMGVLSLEDLLSLKFPNEKPHRAKVVRMLVHLGELRIKYFTKYYAQYNASPIGWDPSYSLGIEAPMAQILYIIRSKGYIPYDLLDAWQIFRFPVEGGDNVEVLSKKKSRDKKNHPHHKFDIISNKAELIDVENPKYDGYENEYFSESMTPAEVENKGKHIHKAVDNDIVRRAIAVREILDESITLSDKVFIPVRLGEDLTIIPHLWDVIFANPADDPEWEKAGAINFQQYNEACEFHRGALELIFKAKSLEIKGITDVGTCINDVISALSKAKGILNLVGKNDSEKLSIKAARYRKFLQQVLLRLTKVLYTKFMSNETPYKTNLVKMENKHRAFIRLLIQKFSAHTLDSSITAYPIKVLEEHNNLGQRNTFFSNNKYDRGYPLEITYAGPQALTNRTIVNELVQPNKTTASEENKH